MILLVLISATRSEDALKSGPERGIEQGGIFFKESLTTKEALNLKLYEKESEMKTTIVSKSSKNLIGRMMLIVALLFIAATMSSLAEAQIPTHGISISKGCITPLRVCDTSADCSDNNLCTNDVCDTTLDNTTHCEIKVSYLDDFGDNVLITNVTDTLGCSVPNTACVVTVNPEIEAVSGNTTCVVGGSLPCTIGPAIASLGTGSVLFHVAGYNPTQADYDNLLNHTLIDHASVTAVDQCDSGVGTAACLAAPNRFAQTEAATVLVNACTNPSIPCNPIDACHTAACDAVNGCVQTPIVCNDNNSCTTDTCNPATGCVFTGISCDDNNACTTDICNTASGCTHTAISCDDNNACTTDICNTVTGCVHTAVVCDDNNPCTTDTCDTSTGCVFTPNTSCNLTCRTPGYWGTHACPCDGSGCEEQGGSCAQNVTQAVIDHCGGCLEVCGQALTNTCLDDASSAVEGICVSPAGNITLQLARQLTAMSLNCCQSGLGADCSGNADLAKLFSDCNNICQGISDTLTAAACRDIIDCFNNGGGGTDSAICGTLPACPEGTAFDVLGLSPNCNSTGSSNECKAASLISNNNKPCPDCNYCAVIPLPADVECGPKTKSNPAIGQGQECCSVDNHPTSCPAIL